MIEVLDSRLASMTIAHLAQHAKCDADNSREASCHRVQHFLRFNRNLNLFFDNRTQN